MELGNWICLGSTWKILAYSQHCSNPNFISIHFCRADYETNRSNSWNIQMGWDFSFVDHWMIPELFSCAFNFPIQKFLQSQSKIVAMAAILGAVVILHAFFLAGFWCWSWSGDWAQQPGCSTSHGGSWWWRNSCIFLVGLVARLGRGFLGKLFRIYGVLSNYLLHQL